MTLERSDKNAAPQAPERDVGALATSPEGNRPQPAVAAPLSRDDKHCERCIELEEQLQIVVGQRDWAFKQLKATQTPSSTSSTSDDRNQILQAATEFAQHALKKRADKWGSVNNPTRRDEALECREVIAPAISGLRSLPPSPPSRRTLADREQPCTCTGSCRGPKGLGEGWICSLKLPPAHNLYETGDPRAPDSIKDRNGEVVLGLCKRCGRGESELSEPCEQRPQLHEGKL